MIILAVYVVPVMMAVLFYSRRAYLHWFDSATKYDICELRACYLSVHQFGVFAVSKDCWYSFGGIPVVFLNTPKIE